MGRTPTPSRFALAYLAPPPRPQLEPLRQWTVAGKPVWGTCAGMIMVADRAEGQKAGGQALIGGLDILVSRNYFGSQSASFEAPLEIAPISLSDSASSGGGDVIVTASSSLSSSSSSSHSLLAAVSIVAPIGVFIRAPAILQCGVGVVPLAFVSDPRATADSDKRRVCVAAASHAIVVTAFHPELSRGTAWHAFFARLVEARTGVTLLPIATAAAVTFDASSPLPTTFDSELATSGNGMVYGVARRVVPGEAPWGSSKNHA